MASFPLGVEKWRPRVYKHAAGLPLDFLMAWIAMESGGNPAALGTVTEVGLFQIDMQDGPAFGGDVDSLHRNFAAATSQVATRELTEAEKELQVACGLAMVRAYEARSKAQLAAVGAAWTAGSSDFWNLVKLQHALPAIPRSFLPAFRTTNGAAPSSWRVWCDWLNGLSRDQVAAVSPAVARYYGSNGKKALTRFTDNAERCGQYGGVEILGMTFHELGALALLLVLLLMSR